MTPKKTFILDENVLIFAQRGENERGEPDATCAALVNGIVAICHTIAVDNTLFGKYLSQLNRHVNSNAGLGSGMLRVLMNAVQISGKIDDPGREPAPSFPEEHLIPQGSHDDAPLVRLAVATRAALVTADNPLKADLESSGIRARYSFQVVTPGEALASLGERQAVSNKS